MLALGYSHPILFDIPKGIEIAIEKQTHLTVTGVDRQLVGQVAANLRRLEQAAWPIFRAGHIPMIGEWVALPVLESAGASGPLDPMAAEVMYPIAHRLLQHCHAVLRLPGESAGADEDVRIAKDRGLPVYTDVDQIPVIS